MRNDSIIIQQATGAHTYMLNLTVKDHANYCLKHKFDYLPLYADALTGKDKDRHAFWNKVYLIRKAISDGYRYVIWLDSDCYIADDTVDLRDVCPDDGYGLTWHKSDNWDTWGENLYDHHNMGAIYCGVGERSKLLTELWWESSDFEHVWHDQHAFNKDALKKYRIRTLADPPITQLGYEFNSTREFNAEKPVVAAWHGYGTMEQRIFAMQTFIQDNKARLMIDGCSIEEAAQKASFCLNVGNLDNALMYYKKAEELGCESVEFLTAYANCYIHMHRWQEAIPLLKKVLDKDPDNGNVWRMLSGSYDMIGEHELNREMALQAVKCSPLAPSAMLNKTFTDLRAGDWKTGFKNYEWEFIAGTRTKRYITKEWDGKPCKTLFVWCEQGLGDTIMLYRFVKDIKNLFDVQNIIFEVQTPLVKLFQSQADKGIHVVERLYDRAIPWEFDEHIGMFSLPALMDATVESIEMMAKSYIKQDFHWWAPQSDGDELKIGFSWEGNPDHGNSCNRNTQAYYFDDLVKFSGTKWYSLQRDVEIPDAVKESTPEVTWIGDDFKDMYDTACALSNLDLVITIDSAIAHLAGAMGKTVLLLLSKSSDWRWLIDRIDTPWYPSVKIIRQKTLGDWEEVFDKVTVILKELLDAKTIS